MLQTEISAHSSGSPLTLLEPTVFLQPKNLCKSELSDVGILGRDTESGFALAAAWSAAPAPTPIALEDAELHFECFIQNYDRNYANANEKQARFQIFKENLENINSLNENSKHATFGTTQFSDLSQEEFKSKINCLRTPDDSRSCKYYFDEDIDYNDAPESFDWREHGAVTPVKDQGTCGSCYAFSTIGNIEGQYAIKHKELVRLSEQQIVDCDERDSGCGGGLMNDAMRTLIEEGGCETEADYPYTAEDLANCSFETSKVKVQMTDCRSYNLTSQEKLKQLLYHTGPISIGVQGSALHHYTNGIISDEECNQSVVTHAVLLVGYGSENGEPFWIVKNSWGITFGEEGYFRMHRGEDALSCGMMNEYMASAVVA